jgi:hypothetical protein
MKNFQADGHKKVYIAKETIHVVVDDDKSLR